MSERLYVVNDDPQPTKNHLVLENGSAVVCVMTDAAVALNSTA